MKVGTAVGITIAVCLGVPLLVLLIIWLVLRSKTSGPAPDNTLEEGSNLFGVWGKKIAVLGVEYDAYLITGALMDDYNDHSEDGCPSICSPSPECCPPGGFNAAVFVTDNKGYNFYADDITCYSEDKICFCSPSINSYGINNTNVIVTYDNKTQQISGTIPITIGNITVNVSVVMDPITTPQIEN